MDEKITPQCYGCKCTFNEKPWMIVDFKGDNIQYYTCSYICTNQLNQHLKTSYWEHIVNKDDFTGSDFLRPTLNIKNRSDITASFDMKEIRDEIKREETRIEQIEKEWGYSSEDGSMNEYNSE